MITGMEMQLLLLMGFDMKKIVSIIIIFFIIGIILIIVSAISCIFGYCIRELWPTTNTIYEIGIPYIIGILGVIFLVIFFGIFGVLNQVKLRKNK